VAVDMSGPAHTTPATLYDGALDADLPHPILGDRYAKDIVERIDYDWTKTADSTAGSPGCGRVPASSGIVAASVTDPAWLRGIPTDRPTPIIGEGLTMYLTEQDGVALLRRLVDRFPSGELQFDAFNRLAVLSQWMNIVVRRCGSTLYWGIDGPDEILRAVPGTRILAWESVFDSDAFQRARVTYRVMARLMSVVPALRYMSQ
jgi:O-methyltransferase involved in polyketide biosynthesis